MPTNLLINHNIHFSVNGGYTDWDPWSPCTGYCGSGLQTRTRSCSNPEPAYNGAGCAGASEETQDCEHSTPCSGLFIDTVHFVDAINGAMYRVPPPHTHPLHFVVFSDPSSRYRFSSSTIFIFIFGRNGIEIVRIEIVMLKLVSPKIS